MPRTVETGQKPTSKGRELAICKDKDLRNGRMLEVRVNPDDIGKVIGRSGRTATALRTVISALAGREPVRVDFVDVDRPVRRGNGGGRGRRP